MNKFQMIKNRISCKELLEQFGIITDKYGRCACPIHKGKDRNFKCFDGDAGYYCFVCHDAGDVIRLAENLLGCSPSEAANWIIQRFNLNIQPVSMTNAEEAERAKQERTDKQIRQLHQIACNLYCAISGKNISADELSRMIDSCDYLLERTEALL